MSCNLIAFSFLDVRRSLLLLSPRHEPIERTSPLVPRGTRRELSLKLCHLLAESRIVLLGGFQLLFELVGTEPLCIQVTAIGHWISTLPDPADTSRLVDRDQLPNPDPLAATFDVKVEVVAMRSIIVGCQHVMEHTRSGNIAYDVAQQHGLRGSRALATRWDRMKARPVGRCSPLLHATGSCPAT